MKRNLILVDEVDCSFCNNTGKCIQFDDAEGYSDEHICQNCLIKMLSLFINNEEEEKNEDY